MSHGSREVVAFEAYVRGIVEELAGVERANTALTRSTVQEAYRSVRAYGSCMIMMPDGSAVIFGPDEDGTEAPEELSGLFSDGGAWGDADPDWADAQLSQDGS